MKKSLVLLIAAALLLSFTGLASANYIEEYTGYQSVQEGQSFDFGFDMWYTNDVYGVGTSSSLDLTTDAEGAFSDWTGATLNIDFYSTDWASETAGLKLTAWGNDTTFDLGTVYNAWTGPWNDGSGTSGTYSFTYDFTQGQLDAFSLAGWGNLNISAVPTGWSNYNDFGIEKVSLDVSTVPEPATLVLLGSGLAGLAFYRRKRK